MSQLNLVDSDDEQADVKPKKLKQNKWANKCMYGEVLEMDEAASTLEQDGLPTDLTQPGQWIVLAPVPAGKRCIAVVHQSSGPSNEMPNTTLRSRAHGKTLMRPFPSYLPPNTILDCILDPNWRQNGYIHVLDVLRWKGQDIRGCEVPFRMWWRDTRLSELSQDTHSGAHPSVFHPVPYYPDISLSSLIKTIIPAAKLPLKITSSVIAMGEEMDLDVPVQAESDGLLLYVSPATYEEGPSELVNWVPLNLDGQAPIEVFERLVHKRIQMSDSNVGSVETGMDM